MELSRKRARELKKLRSNAERLWAEQKDVLDHANRVVKEARRQASTLAKEEMSPLVRGAYQDRLKPVVATGIAATRHAATSARDKVVHEVMPAVSSVLGSATGVVALAKDPRVISAVRKAQAKKAVQQKSAGPGRYIAIGAGVIAVAGIAYAAWQTLRADDELWVEDAAESVEPPESQLDDL